MLPIEIVNAVYAVPVGGPAYQAACSLCFMRQLDPHSLGSSGLQNWQTVIAEAILLRLLSTAA
jgi:hypothetical protein